MTLTQVFKFAVVSLLFLMLMSCQTTGLKIGNLDVGKLVNSGVKLWDANNIDQEQEIQFGMNMSAVLLGVRPLHPNSDINFYVNKVGRWLARNSARPELPWQFGVIQSDSINAFAAPGGYVFITEGMLLQLNNEAELAAILAHEIAHVNAQHHLNAIKSDSMHSALTETLFVSAEAYQANTGKQQKQRQYTAWAKTVTNAAQELYTKGLARDDELYADQEGLTLLAKSGYDPYAYISSLQLIEAIAADDSSLALLYKTHPLPSERIALLAENIGVYEEVEGQLLARRFHQYVRANTL